jgi:hypothetical protein
MGGLLSTLHGHEVGSKVKEDRKASQKRDPYLDLIAFSFRLWIMSALAMSLRLQIWLDTGCFALMRRLKGILAEAYYF